MAHALMNDPKIGLSDLRKDSMKPRRAHSRRGLGGMGSRYDHNALYTYIKFPKNLHIYIYSKLEKLLKKILDNSLCLPHECTHMCTCNPNM